MPTADHYQFSVVSKVQINTRQSRKFLSATKPNLTQLSQPHANEVHNIQVLTKYSTACYCLTPESRVNTRLLCTHETIQATGQSKSDQYSIIVDKNGQQCKEWTNKRAETRYLLSAFNISMTTKTDRAMVIGLRLKNTAQSIPSKACELVHCRW